MKQKFKSMPYRAKKRLVVPITIALNLMLMLSFILIIVTAIQHFQ